MKPGRLAIFDFDGTVADSAEWSFGVFNEVARRYGFREVSTEQREMLRGCSSREIVAYLGAPAWKLPLIARHVRKIAARDIDRICLFPWAPDLFSALRSHRAAIAIVSSNSEANIRHVLGPDLASMVGYYGTGASLFGKAVKIEAIIRKSGFQKDAVTAVGDEVRDIEAAHAAGISSLAVTWGYAAVSALEAAGPTRLVHRPEELLECLIADANSR